MYLEVDNMTMSSKCNFAIFFFKTRWITSLRSQAFQATNWQILRPSGVRIG